MALQQLQSFTGKSPLPMYVNGKLLTYEGSIVRIAVQNGRNQFSIMRGGVAEVLPEGVDPIHQREKEFYTDYGKLFQNDVNYELKDVFLDRFANVLVITCDAYDALMSNLCGNGIANITPTISKFIGESILNYTDIYLQILDRRLSSPKFPLIFKGHLVGGVYKTIILDSMGVKSPLNFQMFRPILEKLNAPLPDAPGVNLLENIPWAGVSASEFIFKCMSSSDFSKVTGAPLYTNFSRKDFIVCFNAALARVIDSTRAAQVMSLNRGHVLLALDYQSKTSLPARNELQRNYLRVVKFLASCNTFVSQTLTK